MTWNFDTTYFRLPSAFYHKQSPGPLPKPQLLIANECLATELGLTQEDLELSLLSGKKLLPGLEPFAQAYSGHQFGHFTQLGDGRALILGEHVAPSGERFDIQLKGSGVTPYSRRGDGKAALGPMLREYLISEAMLHLGIPTTRSLAVITTGEAVYRESILPGAILVRVAKSHLRVGTFEFAATLNDKTLLQQLADYAIGRHFSDLNQSTEPYLELLKAVTYRQAELVAQWLLVGFVHGVMNTDNMSICGETIDYGPCAFINEYDPATVFSSIDRQGRYAFGNQPSIALWNLSRFAETLLPLIDSDFETAKQKAETVLEEFWRVFQNTWQKGLREKLGLSQPMEMDHELINEWLHLLKENKGDFTQCFWELSSPSPSTDFFKSPKVEAWVKKWLLRLKQEPFPLEEVYSQMQSKNPVLIPRNHRVEEALAAAQEGNFFLFQRLLKAVSKPYELDPAFSHFQVPPTQEEKQGYQTFCGT